MKRSNQAALPTRKAVGNLSLNQQTRQRGIREMVDLKSEIPI
jgi:hypothetical protein